MSKDFAAHTARRAFERYNATGPNAGLSHDGKPVPGWDDIAPDRRAQIHGKWVAAASLVADEVISFMVDKIRSGAGWADAEEMARIRFTIDESHSPAVTYSGDTG